MQQLETEGASMEDIRSAKNKVRSCRNSLERVTLQVFQNQWVKDQKDWKIRIQEKEKAEDLKSTELVEILFRIIPKRGRLTKMMLSNKVISKQEREQAITDLYLFITRDYTVLYHSGEEPINGACPVESCHRKMER